MGEGEGRVTSAELPRASRRTNLSRPVARSFTRSTEEALPAIQGGPVRGGSPGGGRRGRGRRRGSGGWAPENAAENGGNTEIGRGEGGIIGGTFLFIGGVESSRVARVG